jgi:hypothetical protein
MIAARVAVATLLASIAAGCGPSRAGVRPDAPRAAAPAAAAVDPCSWPHAREVAVATAAELAAALSAAGPGDLIRMAAGRYAGRFVAAASGTSSAAITLCGPRAAVLDGGDTGSGYALDLRGSFVVLSGFAVRNAQKGIVVEGASSCVLDGLEVASTGMEGVHFRARMVGGAPVFSRHDVLRRSYVHDTGLINAGFGEGVYIGSARSNWATYSGGQPDRSDGDDVTDNRIEATTAECVDVKEGTTGGAIRGNHFDGSALAGQNAADSWVDVKGNGYTIEGNTGTNAGSILQDGYQVHVAAAGWGNRNVFRNNASQVNGPGYAIRVQGAATGTVVGCDNTETGAASGLSNVTCQ